MRAETQLKAVLPPVSVDVYSTHRHLARLTGKTSWRMALRRDVRAAILGKFNLSALPDRSLRNGSTVVDVGANLGDWSAAVLALVRPQQLVMFEPDPRLLAGLEQRFRGHPEVSLVPKAVGRDIRTVELLQAGASWSNSTLQPLDWYAHDYGHGNVDVQQRSTVEQVDLDSALSTYRKIDVLKIDVQGVELDVIAGAQQTLARTATVVLEANWRHHYSGDAVFSDLNDAMATAGFELTNISPPNHNSEGRALWSDVVYMSTVELEARKKGRG